MPFEGIEPKPTGMIEIQGPTLEKKKAEYRQAAQKFMEQFERMQKELQTVESEGDPAASVAAYDKAATFLSDSRMRMGALKDSLTEKNRKAA